MNYINCATFVEKCATNTYLKWRDLDMKRFIFNTIFCLIIFVTGCQSDNSSTIDTSKHAEPQYLYSKNPRYLS